MPTYEYRCPKGHEFEKFQRMSDPPVADCPECGQAAERVLSGGAGLLFKGEGFYITDYRSESYKKAAEKEKAGGGKESSSKAEGKGDAKKESGGGSSGSGGPGGSSGSSGGSGGGTGGKAGE